MDTLSGKTITGILWSGAGKFMARGVSVLVTILLAYFLTPEDYGLLSMMAVFLSIASTLMDSGFKQALIRIPDAKQEDFNTAFYANIVLGIFSFLLLFFAAPYVAIFYDEPRLILLIQVTGMVVIINAFQVVQYASLSRSLNFKAQFRATLPASIISASVAVALAYMGYGVWALVAQMLLSAFLTTVFLWLQSLWRPSFECSRESLRSMYSFGYKLFLSSLLNTGFKNMYVVVIAKTFSSSLAGLYFFADRVRELVIYQVVSALQQVTYPALSTIQNEPDRLKAGYKKIVSVVSFILFPFILFVASLADSVFQLLLPERWWSSAQYLQLMCIAGVLVPLHAVNLNILKVMGRSDLFLWLQLIKQSVAMTILLISYRYGVIWILLGQMLSSILAYFLNSYYSKHLIGYSTGEQLMDFLPTLLLASCVAAGLWYMQSFLVWSELPKLLVLGCAGVFLYLLGAKIMKLHALEILVHLFKLRVKRRLI